MHLALGFRIRCCLIEASLHSLAGNIPPDLLAMLVVDKIWTFDQAINHIRMDTDGSNQSEAISALLPVLPSEKMQNILYLFFSLNNKEIGVVKDFVSYLPAHLLEDVLSYARVQDSIEVRARRICELTQRLPQLLPEALSLVKNVIEMKTRGFLIGILIETSTDKYLDELLMEIQDIPNFRLRIKLLYELAKRSLNAKQAFLSSAIEILSKIKEELLFEEINLDYDEDYDDEYYRGEVLSDLVQYIPDEYLEDVLQAIRKLRIKDFRSKLLCDLVKRKPEVLKEAILATREAYYPAGFFEPLIWTWPSFGEQLCELAPYSPDLTDEIIELLKKIHDEHYRLKLLCYSVANLPLDKMEKVLPIAKNILAGFEFVGIYELEKLFTSFAERLPDAQLGEVLDLVNQLSNQQDRILAFCALLKRMPSLAPNILALTKIIGDIDKQRLLVTALAQCDLRLAQEILSQARKIKENQIRAELLVNLTHCMPEILDESLMAVKDVVDEFSRKELLINLIEHLPESKLMKILPETKRLSDESKEDIIIAMLKRSPTIQQKEILLLTKEIKETYSHARILKQLTLHDLDLIKRIVHIGANTVVVLKNGDSFTTTPEELPKFIPNQSIEKALNSYRKFENSVVQLVDG